MEVGDAIDFVIFLGGLGDVGEIVYVGFYFEILIDSLHFLLGEGLKVPVVILA